MGVHPGMFLSIKKSSPYAYVQTAYWNYCSIIFCMKYRMAASQQAEECPNPSQIRNS